jgi:hypothetical protein
MFVPNQPPVIPRVLHIDAGELESGLPRDDPGDGYRALLSGPHGSGTARLVTISGKGEPHDLIIVEYDMTSGHRRAWLRGETCTDGTIYSFLAELPASFPARAVALIGE